MAYEVELKTKNAGFNARGAAINAEYISRMNAATWTSAQRAAAQTVIDLVDCAYEFEESFKNFRKTFIAIKFSKPKVIDPKQAKIIDEIFAERGYSKAVTEQGIVIRIPRAVA